MRDLSEYKFVFDDNLLYRCCTKSDSVKQLGQQALVVPAQCRKVVLSTSHESPLAGHFGHRKTDLLLREHFSGHQSQRMLETSVDRVMCVKRWDQKEECLKFLYNPSP